MSGCPGVHCPGCGKGGLSAGAIALILLVVGFLAVRKRITAAGHAVEHSTDVLLHTTWEVIEWGALVLACTAGLAITIGLLYGITVLARRYVDRHAVARVPETIVTSCTILPRSTPVPGDTPEPLAIEPGPSLLLALVTALASVGHEGAPTGSDHDQALSLKGAQAFARRRLRNPELLMNGDDARDHRAGR